MTSRVTVTTARSGCTSGIRARFAEEEEEEGMGLTSD